MTCHFFNTKIAEKYGLEEAILFQNIVFWTEKYIKNEEHYYDGFYWLYNSRKAWCELFPYISESKIRRALNNLILEGLLQDGSYNKDKYNHTKWYSLTEKGLQVSELNSKTLISKNVNSIGEFNQSSGDDNQSKIGEFNQSYKITNNKHTNIKNNKKTAPKVPQIPTNQNEEIIAYYNQHSTIKAKLTDKTINNNLTKILKEHTINDVKLVIKYILNNKWHIENGYTGLTHITRPTKFSNKLETAQIALKSITIERLELKSKPIFTEFA